MPDEIIAKRDSKPPHPDGSYLAVCVDVVNLGEMLDTYQGRAEIVPKCALVFQTTAEDAETGKPLEIHAELTVSFGKKAKLRKMLESWRGRPYSDDEARQGIPLHKLEKQNAIVNVIHKVSQAGNTYAVIDTISPPMKGMARVEPKGYKRADFWETRKKEYAEGVAKHRRENAPRSAEEVLATVPDDDSDLPF